MIKLLFTFTFTNIKNIRNFYYILLYSVLYNEAQTS